MQSWVRRSNKIQKEKDNRKIQWRINMEIINRINEEKYTAEGETF